MIAGVPVLSILQPIEDVMLSLLKFFHGSVGLSWAWSIVALTILVRVCIVPLTVRQIHSMQSLQKHAPEMKEIQRKYKGDRQKLNEELMKFYKENSINPAASCLPLVAQLPFFFSLYLVLKHHTDNITGTWLNIVHIGDKHATAHWSGILLLVIYATSQLASTWFMSTTMDKTQRWVMMVMPIAFIAFIAKFPVGLVLYWVTTNLWTVGQGLVTRRLVPKTPAPVLGKAKPKSDDGGGGNGARKEPPKPKPAPAVQASPQPRRVKRKKGGARR